jgi:hypothetical protein
MESIRRMAHEGSPLIALAQHRGQLATLHRNLLSIIKIRQGVPKVNQLRQLAATTVWLTMTRGTTLPKTAT